MIRPALAFTLFAAATPTWAQTSTSGSVPSVTGAPNPSILDGDNITVGVGGILLPSYEGSDTSVLTGGPVVRGRVSGFDFASRGPGLGVDLIREPVRSKINLQLGPVISFNFDRTNRIKDTAVNALGEKKVAFQAGGFAGVSVNGVLNPFDTVGAEVEIVTDVGSVHNGTLITPSISYLTPLSTAIFALVTVSATRASDNYNDTYFSVTPSGSLASGLPVFRADGGWKNAGGSLSLAYDLSGDLRDGGFVVFGRGSYSRLQEDAARSPIVSIRGDRDQLSIAGGVAYTF